MELFPKIFGGWKSLIIFAKKTILEVSQGSEYASEEFLKIEVQKSEFNILCCDV